MLLELEGCGRLAQWRLLLWRRWMLLMLVVMVVVKLVRRLLVKGLLLDRVRVQLHGP